jgi:hypothetical protein
MLVRWWMSGNERAGQTRVTHMSETFVAGLHVVIATNGPESQFWVAATPRDKAAVVVQKRLEDGWKASLTEQQVTVRQAQKLKLRLNGACRWNRPNVLPSG